MRGAIRVSPENVGNKNALLGSLAGTGGRNRPRPNERLTLAVLILGFHPRVSS